MTFRATTREQFRLVLRWVKEHPVLARGDNEVEKGGRELKTKLWKELTIVLNEIGPPVRTWMEWKRVLTDYKYSLKKKIQRRIANTTQGGSEILASLSDLETEALQASLLDWDFGEIDKGLSETPPPDASQMSQNSSDDILQTSASESQENNCPTNQPQIINGNSTSVETMNNSQMVNGSNGNLNVQQINENSLSLKMEESNFAATNITPNGITQVQQTSSLPMEQVAPAQENLARLQPVPATDLMLNGAHFIKILEDGTQEIQHLPFPVRQEIATNVPQVVQVSQPDNMLPTASIVPSTVEVVANVQSAIIPQPQAVVTSQPAESAETINPAQLQVQSTPEIQSTMQQSPVQSQVQTQAQLSNEEMNKLIAREIDRMASTQKRKTTQRKRETREKTKASQESSAAATREQKSSQNQSVQSSSSTASAQPKEKSRRTSEQTERPKRQPPKRPRPKPIAATTTTSNAKEGRPEKRFLSSREFRHCLLQLLAEANEMEKRRIAITETKVRNQTEIQNLEITRMNLEIMKLQKEITLLDHGAKILP